MSLPRPTDTQCPVCMAIFRQPLRVQGGGTRTIYCSAKCRSKDWARKHPAERKAAILKYETAPRNQAKIAAKRLKDRLTKYGLSPTSLASMLVRQKERCAGCSTPITLSAHIDHDHITHRVRGLLCQGCNHAIGEVQESRATLYQLAAYLELDRSTPVVYLVGSLRNPKVTELGNKIRELGIECIDNWMGAGKLADDSWQEYSNARGRTYKEALESREAEHVYHFDRAYLNLSDAVVMLYPAGKSGHLEFGYALGQGKRGYTLIENLPKRYDVMLQFAGGPLFSSTQQLLDRLKADLLEEAL